MKIAKLDDGTTEVDIKMLDDNSGRALIHWLRECPEGKIELRGHPRLREVQGAKVEQTDEGPVSIGHYEVVCRPEQDTIESQKRGNVRYLCMTSGELTSVTCEKCLASPLAKTLEPDPKAAQLVMDTIRSIGV
jgi:hypothetical protein